MSARRKSGGGGGATAEAKPQVEVGPAGAQAELLSPEKMDALFDTVYWLRQAIGLVLGIVFGIIPVRGTSGFLGFISLNMSIPYTYWSKFPVEDTDNLELLKEGFQAAFGIFLTTWILVYTFMHGGKEIAGDVIPPTPSS